MIPKSQVKVICCVCMCVRVCVCVCVCVCVKHYIPNSHTKMYNANVCFLKWQSFGLQWKKNYKSDGARKQRATSRPSFCACLLPKMLTSPASRTAAGCICPNLERWDIKWSQPRFSWKCLCSLMKGELVRSLLLLSCTGCKFVRIWCRNLATLLPRGEGQENHRCG